MSDHRWPSEEPPPPDGLGGWGAAYDAWKTTEPDGDDPRGPMFQQDPEVVARLAKADRISRYQSRSDGTAMCSVCKEPIPVGGKCNAWIGRKGGWLFICDPCNEDSQRQRHEKATTPHKEPW